MKVLIVVFVQILIDLTQTHALSKTTIDWSSIKRLQDIPSYVKNFGTPKFVDLSPTIVGGELAGPSDIPYQAGLILHFNDGNGWSGGALISENFVLTAANCLYNLPTATVVLGISDITSVGDVVPIQRLILHEHFIPEVLENDIGLVHLSRPARLSAAIQIVRLPRRSHNILSYVDQIGQVSGWGSLTEGNDILPVQYLRFARLPIITHLTCRLALSFLNITDRNICTRSVDGTPCLGDDGGPLTIEDPDGMTTLVGIVSHTSSTGCSRLIPAAYTRTSPFLDWIGTNSDVIILD